MNIIRYNQKWFKINPKPYEPDRQSQEIAWSLVREPLIIPEELYKKYFEKQRKISKVLYPSFRKDGE